MLSTPDFQPCQILCQEHENRSLYAEVIQIVAERPLCWVRPLILAIQVEADTPDQECTAVVDQPMIYDLRQDSDLLWPIQLFRHALDTEILPLLEQLSALQRQPEGDRMGRQQFRSFIYQVWRAYPEVFEALN